MLTNMDKLYESVAANGPVCVGLDTEIGYLPKVEDINLDGIDVDPDTLAGLLSVDRDLWKQETEGMPMKLFQWNPLKKELGKLKLKRT